MNSTNFPDAVFRQYVSDNFSDGSGYLNNSDISTVTYINVYEKGISSLKGIEYFTGLVSLDCRYNELTALDVTKKYGFNGAVLRQ